MLFILSCTLTLPKIFRICFFLLYSDLSPSIIKLSCVSILTPLSAIIKLPFSKTFISVDLKLNSSPKEEMLIKNNSIVINIILLFFIYTNQSYRRS